MKIVITTATTILNRYLEPKICGSQPTLVFWLMIPILPDPLGTSHTIV